MKTPTHTPKEFCKIVTHFTGEQISDPEQIKMWKMNGTEIFELCSFYFKEVYSNFTVQELRRQQNINYRLKVILYVLLIVIAILIINK
jgi:hypothetical protein